VRWELVLWNEKLVGELVYGMSGSGMGVSVME
jgi:hypothetical protein